MANEVEKIKAQPTEKIVVDQVNSEQEYRQMTKEELLHLLNYVETNPENIKLIKKVLKTKA